MPISNLKLILPCSELEFTEDEDRLFKRPFPSQNTPPPSSRTPAQMLVGTGRSLLNTDHGPAVCRS